MPPDVPADRIDAIARSRISDAVDEACPQGELLAVMDDLGLPENVDVVLVRELQERRRAGRPPGARNRRSESLAAQVERLFGNPVLRAAALATMPVQELAAALGCKPFEALQEQRLWLSTVLPYVAARMPIAVDVTNHRVVNLTIVDGTEAVEHDASDVVEVVDYQRVSDEPDAAV